jgi:hypothetical protein
MSNNSSGTSVIGAGIFVLLLVAGFGALVSRQPPDPFTDEDEPREVECRVTWETSPDHPVGMDTYCEVVGQEDDDNDMDAVGILESPWFWITTGIPGQSVYFSALPSRQTEGTCVIKVNGETIATEDFSDDMGCEMGQEGTLLIS